MQKFKVQKVVKHRKQSEVQRKRVCKQWLAGTRFKYRGGKTQGTKPTYNKNEHTFQEVKLKKMPKILIYGSILLCSNGSGRWKCSGVADIFLAQIMPLSTN